MDWLDEHTMEELLSATDPSLAEVLRASAAVLFRPETFRRLALIWDLTPREVDVAILLTMGLPAKAIGLRLQRSGKTAEAVSQRVRAKLGVETTAQLAVKIILASGLLLGNGTVEPATGKITFGAFGRRHCRHERENSFVGPMTAEGI